MFYTFNTGKNFQYRFVLLTFCSTAALELSPALSLTIGDVSELGFVHKGVNHYVCSHKTKLKVVVAIISNGNT